MTQPKFTEAKAAWNAILAGIQRMGMESEAINTVDEYFAIDANWSRIVDREREVDDWLVRQLEAWPIRVDPERTTNIVFLMNEAAKRLRPGINPAALASNSPVVGEDGPPETIDGVETGNTVAPNTPTTAGRRDAVARIIRDYLQAGHTWHDDDGLVQGEYTLADAILSLVAARPTGEQGC